MSKRQDYISWDDFFFGVADLASKRSKDPATQVGACIVDEDKRIVGVGYNGMPLGTSDDCGFWKKSDDIKNKHLYVCHAEANAILNMTTTSKNCVMYVTKFPCNECAKLIVNSKRIKQICYFDPEIKKEDKYMSSFFILNNANILHSVKNYEKIL